MKNTVKELSPRAKESVMLIAKKAVENNLSKNEAIKAICTRLVKLGLIENDGNYNAMLAVSLAFYTVEKEKKEGKKPYDCISNYAHFKHMTSVKLNDYGAFADTIEMVLRVSCKPATLVTWNDLHVKRQYETDITIKGVQFEVGINGKTFAESDEYNPMNGRYEKIAYGVFTDEEKEIIFGLLENGRIEEAIKSIRKMMFVFDKETFFDCMTTKTGRSSMFQYKSTAGHFQVIYNPSKHTAFLKMVENENIPSIEEYFKK